MRDFKFRAWSKKQKAFIAGFNMVNFHSYFNKGLEPHIYRYDTEWKLSEIELVQFIGKQDKNGIDIYEKDIVKWLDEGVEHTGPVLFDEHAVGFRVKMVMGYMPSFKLQSHHLEVIGNTFQNIDLLPPSFRE